VRHNALTLLRQGAFADLVVDLGSGQRWLRNAAAVFFMTAVVQRSMWKYRHSHAYRVLNLDAGHIGQTFHLVCTRLGLGPFTTAATRNRAIERELGLDGVSEIVIYTAAVGVRARSSAP
jgi:SagB-type dehydrogenase family enzyme